MAKKSEPNNASRFERESRIKRIENCIQCHGNPNVETFNLQGLVGKHCGTCMEIIEYHKEGKPIVIEEKKIEFRNFQDPDFQSQPILTKKTIPGGIQFDDLLKLE